MLFRSWVIGGDSGGPMNDVWFSENGSEWKAATLNAEFQARSRASAVLYKNRIYLAGGTGKDGKELSDVWWTDDGIIWKRAAESAAFGPRAGALLAAFPDRLVIEGGNSGKEINKEGWYCR